MSSDTLSCSVREKTLFLDGETPIRLASTKARVHGCSLVEKARSHTTSAGANLKLSSDVPSA